MLVVWRRIYSYCVFLGDREEDVCLKKNRVIINVLIGISDR